MPYHEWACGALAGNGCDCDAEPWEEVVKEAEQPETPLEKPELLVEKPASQEWLPDCHP